MVVVVVTAMWTNKFTVGERKRRRRNRKRERLKLVRGMGKVTVRNDTKDPALWAVFFFFFFLFFSSSAASSYVPYGNGDETTKGNRRLVVVVVVVMVAAAAVVVVRRVGVGAGEMHSSKAIPHFRVFCSHGRRSRAALKR